MSEQGIFRPESSRRLRPENERYVFKNQRRSEGFIFQKRTTDTFDKKGIVRIGRKQLRREHFSRTYYRNSQRLFAHLFTLETDYYLYHTT